MSILERLKPRPYVSSAWRWIAYYEEHKRLELQGQFNAEDLRKLADWLDNPKCKVDPIIDVELSEL